MIGLDRLSKSYDDGASYAVENISLRVDRGIRCSEPPSSEETIRSPGTRNRSRAAA